MIRESDIMHENGAFWVLREKFKGRPIYKVLSVGITHSTVCDTIDLGAAGLERAIAKCDARAAKYPNIYATPKQDQTS